MTDADLIAFCREFRDGAARSGLSLTTIVRIEQGHTVSAQSVLAICKFMNVDPFHYMGKRREAA